MLLDLAASIGGIQPKDVIGPLVGGVLGYIGARHTSRNDARIARASREQSDDAAREQRRLANADDLSRRFQILMDGYEARIRDLTVALTATSQEVVRLRERVDALVEELNDRRDACAACPYRDTNDGAA